MADRTSDEPSDFFAGLLRDHAAIQTRLLALDQAALALGRSESDRAALDTVAQTLQFFASEGARHEALEEQTLFPRLRPLPEFKQILSALEFQHRMNEATAKELAACVARFAPGSSRELRVLSYRFAEMHRGHALAEERALFPLAAASLPAQVIAELGREMCERNAIRVNDGASSPALPRGGPRG